MTNHFAMLPKVPHTEAHKSDWSAPSQVTLMKGTTRWPSKVTNVVWQILVIWGEEELAKGPVGKWGGRNLPTQWMHLILLTQIFFIFRSDTAKKNWNDTQKYLEALVKKYTKYGWCFPLSGRVQSCLDSVGMGVPLVRNTEPRKVLWNRSKTRSHWFHQVLVAFLAPFWRPGHIAGDIVCPWKPHRLWNRKTSNTVTKQCWGPIKRARGKGLE